MLFRNCAGGVVFYEDTVLLLQNEKSEWVFPKGVIRGDMLAHEVALTRVESETGVEAEIVAVAGETCYEFYSVTRGKPVCNRVTWYVMRAKNTQIRIAMEQGFLDGGFFKIDEAQEMITYSQDKSLLKIAYNKFM